MVGLRDQINSKPAIVVGIAAAIVLLLITGIVFRLRYTHPSSVSGVQMFYSADDGKTWFPDAFERVPPFDHDGAQAVRCYVFTTSSGGPFAGYLETYTPAVHDYLTGATKTPMVVVVATGTLVKRPGDRNWVIKVSPAGQNILQVKSPDGSSAPVDQVYP